MIRRRALFLIIALSTIKGQQGESAKPLEPDVLGELFYLDSSAHTLKALPKEQWKAATKRYSGSVELSGVSSSFQLPPRDRSEFVFRPGSPTANPLQHNLYMCSQDTKKGVRRYAVIERKSRQRAHGVPFEVVKYGESSYKMILQRLAPGEYAFPLERSVFSFRVD